MKRFSIFLIVGPILGYVVTLIMSDGLKGIGVIFGVGFLFFLPFAFIFGLVPAFIAALADLVLERSGVMSVRRWFTTGVIGYLATYILLLNNYFAAHPLSFNYGMGLTGAVAAVACSWLSEWSKKSETA
ncbi:DUF5413 family protein [Bradyrhizobium sp. 191]|uniref:DUF5413 family protein n=1 Tax=Bradyrhizobium sp. 191 TaxID=2782659 RepID=UPI00077E278A|nr:DUF5413 family protein [Bradyrhizobium sp. 191]KYK44589.1 hypothetical protein A1D31_14440 [Bradyrhizobium liaoningense]UPJ66750.1 DUF5413 family protein [Bradyrhizobium sp. 191]